MSKAASKDGAAAESTPRTAAEMLRMGREFLERKQLSEARLETELLVAHALGIDRLHLFLELDRPLTAVEIARGREMISRRARREPVAYITGEREFYARNFTVNPAVLIPRPETELLVDRAREIVGARKLTGPRCLDVGTGSGAIALTLALEIPQARVVALELSAAALSVARANAEKLSVEPDRVRFLEGDGPLAARAHAPFDLVLSNPPYVAHESRHSLAPEVRDHEPALALFAPAGDPDHWIKRLIAEVPALLAPGGVLLIEIGHDQGERALQLAAPHAARVHRDLARLPRLLEVSFRA